MIVTQGGDAAAFEDRSRLPTARLQHPVLAEADGYVDCDTNTHSANLVDGYADPGPRL